MKHKTKVLYEVDLLCKSIKRSVPQCAAAHFISEASSRPKGTSCSRRERFIPPNKKDLPLASLFCMSVAVNLDANIFDGVLALKSHLKEIPDTNKSDNHKNKMK
jgi:hypothetical protein